MRASQLADAADALDEVLGAVFGVQVRVEKQDADPLHKDGFQAVLRAMVRQFGAAVRAPEEAAQRRIARSQDGKVRLPMILVATVKCSPCGPVKNEQSVAPSTAGSAPMSSSDRSTCARSLTASNVAAIATSIYWPCPVA